MDCAQDSFHVWGVRKRVQLTGIKKKECGRRAGGAQTIQF
jgi:hypothetical protein